MRHSSEQQEQFNIRRFIGRCLAVLGVTVLCVALLLVGTVWVYCTTPSVSVRSRFVATMTESGFLDFVPGLFLSDEQIDDLLSVNSVFVSNALTDITIPFTESTSDEAAITVQSIKGDGYTAKLLTVKDPSRVTLAYAVDGSELSTHQFTKAVEAAAGINGGEIIIKDGCPTRDDVIIVPSAIAFNNEHHLVVGSLPVESAEALGIADAVSAGPALIINGECAEFLGTGSGLAPRAAIGQRADGAILMLVINGYQPNSLGGTYRDCAEIMLKYGAINAACTDAAASLVYDDAIISARTLLPIDTVSPSAFIVA